MSSGKTHDRITCMLVPLAVVLMFFITSRFWLTLIGAGAFLVGGLMMGPDLDIRSVQYKRWGCLKWIWYPYQKLVPHRSFWSHGPIIGTLLRVVYLASAIALISFIAAYLNILSVWQVDDWRIAIDVGLKMLQVHQSYWVAAIAGLELGACSHYVADWISSAIKRKRRQRRRHRQYR